MAKAYKQQPDIMKIRKYIYIILSLLIAVSAVEGVEAFGAKKRSKYRTSKTYSKKNKRSYKSRSKKSRRTVTKAATPAPPPEIVLEDSLTLMINQAVLDWIPSKLNPGGLRINSVRPDTVSKTAKIGLNDHYTYLPVTKEFIDSLSNLIHSSMPDSLRDYRITLNVGSRPLAYFITKVDKLPEKFRKNPPFVTEASPWAKIDRGMQNDIVAMWHSHGRYFKTGSGCWTWQRPLLFQSIEDTYTMSFILPYAVPMLENAGAYVMLPRERDTNRHEVIVDNDINPDGTVYSQPYYKELTGQQPWSTGELEGFIYDLPDFRDTENPFENGTYRQTNTQRDGKLSIAAWYADIPEDGEYAVYISYKSLPNSTEDAHYTVNYSGGTKEFIVNQTMGGGTWIYLGTFPLKRGYSDTEPVVTLTNLTEKSDGLVVTADAVKIGGGMGNIARSNLRSDIYYDPSDPEDQTADESESDDGEEDETEENGDETNNDPADTSVPAQETPETSPHVTTSRQAPVFRTSGMPRFLEGARYWLHWAGMPESIYSPFHGSDDYKDDYTCRGHWVNYLAGGSRVLPNREGLGIPVDVSFALHSDAGKRADDSFVGTLGIYFTQNGESYLDGTPRINSRMLTDIVMRQICNDIRREYEPSWTRRSMWDKSYLEARVAEVPTTLIELMSHQNFADMYYGLDPEIQFTVGRAIYKGIARFLSERKDRKLVIQPLPVQDFAIHRIRKNHYRLSWRPVPDPLEDTAMPDKYVIMERSEGELGFHKIGETSDTHFEFRTGDNKIHSFRIIAMNRGGKSFPSETLALRESPFEKKPILIVNGFTRIGAPAHFTDGNRAGFDAIHDFGVPYIRNFSFTGYQTEFNRNAGESFGRSSSNYIGSIIAGNTFDYPSVHGEAFADAGLGFVSCSASAVEKGDLDINNFQIVDLILGKQKASTIGNGHSGIKHRTFTPEMQKKLRHYSDQGGKMIISGQYVASDLRSLKYGDSDREFASVVLGVEAASDSIPVRSGKIRDKEGKNITYSNTLNDKIYIVESPDRLIPATGAKAEKFLTFSDSDAAAGMIVDRGRSLNAIMSIPIEAINSRNERSKIIKEILKNLKQ